MNTPNPYIYNTGHSASLLVNTKHKGVRHSLLQFMQELFVETEFSFHVRNVMNISSKVAEWQPKFEGLQKGDTLLQLICFINAPLSESEFIEYSTKLTQEDLLPYLYGCGYTTLGNFYNFTTPPNFVALAAGGDKDVLLKHNDSKDATQRMLLDVFALNLEELSKAEFYLETTGEYLLEKKLKEQNIPNFSLFMECNGLTEYEIVA